MTVGVLNCGFLEMERDKNRNSMQIEWQSFLEKER